MLLVSTPLRDPGPQTLRSFGIDPSRTTAPIAAWYPTEPPPALAQHLSCFRHMALCLIDGKVWSGGSNGGGHQPYAERLASHGRFWEHCGPERRSAAWSAATTGKGFAGANVNKAVRWPEDEVQRIEAIQVLGETSLGDNEIDVACE